MWRWIIRVYVSLMVFWILLFLSVATLKEVSHLFLRVDSPWLSVWMRSHLLWTAFLAGAIAGQVPVGTDFTGEGWFRSKDGKTFEGFRLEELRQWTWLILCPLFLLGVVVWWFENGQGILSSPTLVGFYRNVVMADCSSTWGQSNWFNSSCNTQLLFVASWLASIGYSLAPSIRALGSQALKALRNNGEAVIPAGEDPNILKKADS
jgi:hypothetical protein